MLAHMPARSPSVTRPQPHTPLNRITNYLEYLPGGERKLQRLALNTLPFRFGRSNEADFVIPSGRISRVHAEIYCSAGQIRVRDLRSTNGTFLNGRRIEDEAMFHGDILHLAHQELRFLDEEEGGDSDCNLERTDLFSNLNLVPPTVLDNLPNLKDLLCQQLVRTFFQPVCALESQAIIGYEALGRGTHGKLSARPGDLFSLAERCELACELSSVFRAVAVAEARGLPGQPTLFLNMHPDELGTAALLESMRLVREAVPATQNVVLEIHEECIADLASLRLLRQQLHDMGIRLAYDDFGAGQSRLKDLAEVPPDFLKLDMTLIRGLHRSAARQGLLRAINGVARDLGIQVIAEGIEEEEEAEACRRLGCVFGQGYLLGHPQAASSLPEEDTLLVPMDGGAPTGKS